MIGEGDLFAVPLRGGGYGVGLAARTDGEGLVVGFVFGRRFDTPPDAGEVDTADVVWIHRYPGPARLRVVDRFEC